MSGYYLGIDAGGTKTQVALANDQGVVLGRGSALGVNPHNLPTELNKKHLAEAVAGATGEAASTSMGLQIESFESVCVGMAGFDVTEDSQEVMQVLSEIKTKRLIVGNDGLIGLRSGTESDWGVCLIASTGSNCYGVSPSRTQSQAGGWGYLLGDQGSGFNLGKKILERVMKEYDNRKSHTDLGRKVMDALQLQNEAALVRWAYQEPLPISGIASLAQLANEPGLEEVIKETVMALAESYQAVVEQLQLQNQPDLPVVLVGGLFKLKGDFSSLIKNQLLTITPQALISQPEIKPVDGALKTAMMASPETHLPTGVVFRYA